MFNKEDLKKFSFFSDIPDGKLDEIFSFCETESYKKDDLIFSQNDKAEKLYGVIQGNVELSILFQEKALKTEMDYEEAVYKSVEVIDRPIVVGNIISGEIIGWSSFTKSLKMSATAKCIEDCMIFSIPTEKIVNLFQKDPGLGYPLMTKMCEVISNRLYSRTDILIEAWGEAFNSDNIS